MLSEDLEDEDTHMCIKCQSTILGLENYVVHRKSGCLGKRSDRDIIQHADHTYQTFDFPESSKDAEKSFHFNYDIGPDDDQHDVVGGNSRDVIAMAHGADDGDKVVGADDNPNKSLSKSYEYNYGLDADDFFSLLNLQSSSKTKQTQTPTGVEGTGGGKLDIDDKLDDGRKDHDIDWINAPSTSGTDKLMKAVHAISGTRNPQTPTTCIYNYEYSHDSPDPPSEDDDDVGDVGDDDDYAAPPRGHTGGKWKPSERSHRTLLHSSASRWYERWDMPEDSGSHHVASMTNAESNEDLLHDDYHPPPSHTKGKWVPGTKIIKLDYKTDPEPEKMFAEQFWCNSCNRKLSSRSIYERHLRSNLHRKRSQPEAELEEASLPLLRIDDIVTKRVSKPSRYAMGDVYATRAKRRKRTIRGDYAKSSGRVKRKRRCYYIKCDICKTRLRENLFGKHLISHYHYRRMLKNPDDSFDVILRNMHRIVLQSPFQCQPCRFYANTELCFWQHWMSPGHAFAVRGSGRFWCSFCKFECEGSDQMHRHLEAVDHQDVVRAINRSVPIIIRKRTVIACPNCHQEFQYNIELKKHAERCTQAVAVGTASNTYQDTHRCFICGMTFKSTVAYQRHCTRIHASRSFFCRPCEMTFDSAAAAKRHRTTAEHKIKAARASKKDNLKRKCPVCGDIVDDLLLLKEHLKNRHPNDNYP